MLTLPQTIKRPPLLCKCTAQTGLLLGYVNGPDVRMGYEGGLTVKVVPLTNTKSEPILFDSF